MSINRRGMSARHKTVIAAALLSVLALFAVFHSASARAEEELNESFCSNATLGKYGGENDWCAAGGRHGINFTLVQAVEHSACTSTTTNGAKSGTNASWVCTAGGNNAVAENWVNFRVCAYGIVRNNTTGATNRVYGTASYNAEVPC